MALIDAIKKALGAHGKSLDDLPLDDLRREKIRLDQEEAKLIRDVEKVETQKKDLFQKGVNESSQRQQMIVARKIKELDAQAKNMDRQLEFLSRQLRIVNGFMQLKENQRYLKESGLIGVLGKIDLEELQEYVDKASIDGGFQMDKFTAILGTMEEGQQVLGQPQADADVMEIVRLMQQAKEAEASPGSVEENFKQVSQVLAKEPAEKDSSL
jgi:hypothetical protein